MNIEKRLERAEALAIPPEPEAMTPAQLVEHYRALATLAEAMGEILGLESLTVAEMQQTLAEAGIGKIEPRGRDPIGQALGRARALLCRELGLKPEELTEDVLYRILRGKRIADDN